MSAINGCAIRGCRQGSRRRRWTAAVATTAAAVVLASASASDRRSVSAFVPSLSMAERRRGGRRSVDDRRRISSAFSPASLNLAASSAGGGGPATEEETNNANAAVEASDGSKQKKGGGKKKKGGGGADEQSEENHKKEAEPCNVVFTHTNADFDSLAAAVALALLWSKHTYPDLPAHVVLPRGAHPSAQRFLAFHKHLLPLRGFKTILAEDVRAVGMVDAQSADRIGRGKAWLDGATSVHVFDHHEPRVVSVSSVSGKGEDTGKGIKDGLGGSADDEPPAAAAAAEEEHMMSPLERMATSSGEWVVDKVGSTTTLLVERLRDAGIRPSPHEATLFVLGIRADTGGLAYEGTTVRDAAALLWCLENGASQKSVSEFGTNRVSEGQRAALNEALRRTETATVRGLRVSSAMVSNGDRGGGGQYVAGMAQVCEELLDLTDSDVFLLGAAHFSGSGGGNKKKKGAPPQQWLSVIGRASPGAAGVDLNSVMRSLGGGGHPKAAAAALRCRSPATLEEECEVVGVAKEEENDGEQRAMPIEGSSPLSSADAKETPTAAPSSPATKGGVNNNVSLQYRLAQASSGCLSADDALSAALGAVMDQIPEQLVASSFMVPVSKLICIQADMTVDEARGIFDSHKLKSAPVVEEMKGDDGDSTDVGNNEGGEDGGEEEKKPQKMKFRGSLKLNDLVKAARAGRGSDKVRGMVRSTVETVDPTASLAEVEELMMRGGAGRIPVVNDEEEAGTLEGIVTRTDVLRQRKLYDEDDFLGL